MIEDEAFDKFNSYKIEVENSLNLMIKNLRSNWCEKYIASKFIKFYEEHGIKREMVVPYTL